VGEKGLHLPPPVLTGMVFMGAFLLFLMEPYIGRTVTPLYGGSAQAWLICLACFQLALLFGYLYAYWSAARIGRWHLFFLAIPLIGLTTVISRVQATGYPLLSAFLILFCQYFPLIVLLSTTSVIAQIWLTRTSRTADPYPLFRSSNAGALLALLAYPFLIEPLMGLRSQGMVFTAGYILYMILAILSYRLCKPYPIGDDSPPDVLISKTREPEKPANKSLVYWSFLSAFTSALLVTVTTVMVVEAGTFPLVWILPLAVYLLSFILAFDNRYGRMESFISRLCPEVILIGALIYLIPTAHYAFHFVHLLFLFTVCFLIHKALYRERPHPRHLPVYYITMALGGLLGSVAISLAAPLLFQKFHEYPILLVILSVLFIYLYGGTAFLFWRRAGFFKRSLRLAPIFTLAVMVTLLGGQTDGSLLRAIHRNYHGIWRILDESVTNDMGKSFMIRSLVHASTVHGRQFLEESKRLTPTLYYHPTSGLADAMQTIPLNARIAAIGLGVGTVGAYTRSGDRLDYYELDPHVAMLARRWFTFIDHTGADTRIMNGDGRLLLAKGTQTGIFYDLIFVDAFGGEGIPTHLLTEESLKVYADRLAGNGCILFHLTNRYYDLRPVLKATAARFHLYGAMKSTKVIRDESSRPIQSDYVVLTKRADDLRALRDRGWIPFDINDGLTPCRPWTDDYVNILVPLAAKMMPGG